jgi:hypothetical protein
MKLIWAVAIAVYVISWIGIFLLIYQPPDQKGSDYYDI